MGGSDFPKKRFMAHSKQDNLRRVSIYKDAGVGESHKANKQTTTKQKQKQLSNLGFSDS